MKEPLQVHREHALMDLYCPEVGHFKKHEEDFKFRVQLAGYDFESHTRGFSPFIFFIAGSMGTGKSTLINVMRYWLNLTKPEEEPDWLQFEAWESSSPFRSLEYQLKQLQELEVRIMGQSGQGDYCLVLVDNVVPGIEIYALDLFVKLRNERIIVLFLASSEPELIDKSWENSQFNVQPFKTEELTPDDAVAYVKHRMSRFQPEERPSVLDEYDLFPFSEDNIRRAVEARQQHTGQKITIRQLNEILTGALQDKMRQLDDSFDIAERRPSEVSDYTVDVVDYYSQRVDNLRRGK